MKQSFINIIYILIFFGTYLNGAGFDDAVKILKEVLDLFTGSIFQILMGLAIAYAAIKYITGKGTEGKDLLVQIGIGATLLLAASSLGNMFYKGA